MNGSQRREQIVRQIQESKEPVSGKKLAELYSVMILSQRTEDIY